MVPTEVLPPATLSTSQLTFGFDVFVTVATNALNALPAATVTAAGATVTVIGPCGVGAGVGPGLAPEWLPVVPQPISKNKKTKNKRERNRILKCLIVPSQSSRIPGGQEC